MKRLSLWFEGRERVAIREDRLAPPGPGELSLRTLVSAISPGTEMLFYRGAIEQAAEVDAVLEVYRRPFSYPLPYGYASVGRIVETGPDVDARLHGRLAFVFAPHASAFCIPADTALFVPEGISALDAAFLANAETAVNLVLDARPLLGERASVFGLGIVGLLTSGLLTSFPLARLAGYDLHARRREAGAALGLETADPLASPPAPGTEDFAVEVSGSAEGFRMALCSCGYSGRLVVGSWYGTTARQAAIEAFDTAFHRSRVTIVSSQVSTIEPSLTGRWSKARRLEAAWQCIRTLGPARWITHTVPFAEAARAYAVIAESPGETIQVMLVHEAEGTPPPGP
jgi:2-desacetyl-2-hydroxyethyl bacteriochlorophyllide A dehydrogenase